MKLQQIALVSLLGLSTLSVIATAPAQACTPAPDNPNGCDGINGTPRVDRRVSELRQKVRFPVGPVCLSCPPHTLKATEQIKPIQPELQQEKILIKQDRVGQRFEQPQSFGQ